MRLRGRRLVGGMRSWFWLAAWGLWRPFTMPRWPPSCSPGHAIRWRTGISCCPRPPASRGYAATGCVTWTRRRIRHPRPDRRLVFRLACRQSDPSHPTRADVRDPPVRRPDLGRAGDRCRAGADVSAGRAPVCTPRDRARRPMLQELTARMAVQALALSGVPAALSGNVIAIPGTRWHVSEACGGINYLTASLLVGYVYAGMVYRRWAHRLAFVAAAALTPSPATCCVSTPRFCSTTTAQPAWRPECATPCTGCSSSLS